MTLRSAVYFVTTVTAKRRPLFSDPRAAECVATALDHYHENGWVHGYAWVVMPDHIHWIAQLRVGTLSNLMRMLKAWTGRRIRTMLELRPAQAWMSGYHEHLIRPREPLERFVNYLVLNPVRRGLIEHPKDYPYLRAAHGLLDTYGVEPKPF